MKIIVDADATPSLKEIINIAKKHNVECHLFCDYNHNLNNLDAEIHYISEGFQSVDIAISNFISLEDILITQDYGLACIALSKNAKAVNPNGNIYTNNNIDNLLEQRYLNILNRKKNIHTKNIKKRTKEINEKFLTLLETLITNNKK